MTTAGDIAATFCATLVDEWIRAGVTQAMIAPGSRSTPLALALLGNQSMSVEVFHDERSAGFAGLGVGLATGVPAVVLCSSGTAAAHFYAPVIEADQSNVPLIVCTADRPAHLRDVSAPQTIDQTKMFGDCVRWFHEPGVPRMEQASTWRSLAARSVQAATQVQPGPVHLNLPFDEPLFGVPDILPPAREGQWSQVAQGRLLDADDVAVLSRAISGRRGVFICGHRTTPALVQLAQNCGWPILCDPRSGIGCDERLAISHFDPILRSSHFVEQSVPEIVVYVGEHPASKVVRQWVQGLQCEVLQLIDTPQVIDPDHLVSKTFVGDIEALAMAVSRQVTTIDESWLHQWTNAQQMASDIVKRWCQEHWTEVAVAHVVSSVVHPGDHLVVSSSMPIRDVEWFGMTRGGVRVHANRGANGIDGVLATSIGVALATSSRTTVLIGDVALLHDSSSLTALANRDIRLRIVVTNNDGGSIFSFLPQAQHVSEDVFEKMYGTSHGVNFELLAKAHGIDFIKVTTQDQLCEALLLDGPILIEAAFNRGLNVEQHDHINQMVTSALS